MGSVACSYLFWILAVRGGSRLGLFCLFCPSPLSMQKLFWAWGLHKGRAIGSLSMTWRTQEVNGNQFWNNQRRKKRGKEEKATEVSREGVGGKGKKERDWGFPGSSGVRNLPANAGDMGSILVWEDHTCRRATKPILHSYWAYALEPASCSCWSPHTLKPMLCNKRSHRNEKPLYCN